MNASKQLGLPGPQGIVRWVKKLASPAGSDCWRWVHPCTIDNIRHLVHHPALNVLDPHYFSQLQNHALRNGWHLIACRRQDGQALAGACRRKLWIPIWLLACALATPTESMADPQGAQVVHLKHYQTKAGEAIHAEWNHRPTAESVSHTAFANDVAAKRLHKLLLKRWQDHAEDPSSLSADLAKMAGYYSQFPEVVELFSELGEYDWQLRYAERTFSTEVSGSRLQVKSVNIFFDPRSAAQFKFNRACADKIRFCVASPADVLLHELLHAHSVLKAPQQFIEQGGMNTHLYPFEHERQTIRREQALYTAMTAIDQKPRPLRSEHTGRHLAVACATCSQ